ncbi:MAG: hypothetical protein K8S99_01620 [Planctomycetes bacterium]|nr:hypothetical protein [Planctomycetota bacterium]
MDQRGITWKRSAVVGAVVVAGVYALFVALASPLNATHAAPGTSPASGTAATQAAPPTTREMIGLAALEERLGRQAPTGAGVVVAHVEGGKDYLPDLTAPHFTGLVTLHSGGSKEVSGHANATAVIVYGPRGMAPGIRRVYFMPSNGFIGDDCLHVGKAVPPDMKDIRLSTHSWIGGLIAGIAPMQHDDYTADVLRRVDYAADRLNALFVVGVNNGSASAVPPLLASAYNVISVGNYLGQSSGGYTKVEGDGRCKPEIVAPHGLTSFATPVVTAAAARLMEAADRMGPDSPARRVEVLKVVLMAGAEKPEGWKCAPGKPLDEHYGAGRLRIDSSYDILAAGRVTPGTARQRYGWAYESLAPGHSHEYVFTTNRPLGEASIMLVWNRRIDGRVMQNPETHEGIWVPTPRLGDFNLQLIRTDLAGNESVTAESAGTVDNLEHIHLAALQPGRYRIRVVRSDDLAEGWDYALAWRIETRTAKTETIGVGVPIGDVKK